MDTAQGIREPDERLSIFYSLAEKEIPPQERSMLYNEVDGDQNRYSEHVEIAKGGLKRIDRVYDRKTGRHVAYATLREPEQKKFLEPFLREGRLTSTLQHPNIIPVYDLGLDENGNPFFIMELKTGKTLARTLKEHHGRDASPVRLEKLLAIFLKICDAIAYAHSRNILHLDLKPENIQIGEFGEVIICDWGLAKILSTPEGVATDYMEPASNPDLINAITLNGEVKGTPGYMAPEQVTSAEKKTYGTDIYGLGAILYSILTGRAPVSGEVKEMLEKTRKGKIAPPTNLNPAAPKALSAVAMKALQLDPEQRYQCVEDLAADIRKYTEGFVTSAENAGLLKILMMLYLRHKSFFISLLLVIMLIAAITTTYLGHLSRSRQTAVSERERAEAALARVLEEERLIAELSGNLVSESISASYQFWKKPIESPARTKSDFHDALDQLDKALTVKPENQMVWMRKGFLCFLMQRFNEALDCFSRGDQTQELLVPVCREYSRIKADDERLTEDQFAALAAELVESNPNRISTVELMLLYDYAKRRASGIHTKNTKTVLQLLNPEWDAAHFSFNKRHGLVEIGGDGLQHLRLYSFWSSNQCLLRTLMPRHLVFTQTDFSDISQLIGLPLGSLDISKTQVASPDGIQRIHSLVELKVRKGQFSDQELKKLPAGISVQIVE